MMKFSEEFGEYAQEKHSTVCAIMLPLGTEFDRNPPNYWLSFQKAARDLREEALFTYVEGHSGLQLKASEEVKIGGLPDEERPAVYMWKIHHGEISYIKLGKEN